MVQLCLLAVLLPGLASAARAADTYIQTEIDSSGQLRILTKRHREIVPRKERQQVGFEKAEISPDGRTVGWLELYSTAGDSDRVPLKLAIYTGDNLRTFTGTGLPIRRWRFQAEGKQVAFEQETVHGGIGVHYELRDIESGDLVAKFDPESDSVMIAKPPRWVAEVASEP
jgi:hypothetical protein